MYQVELQKLEGVWTGTERIVGDNGATSECTGRMEFHTVFDGRFLLCDYVQTAPDRPVAVAHGVFWKDEGNNGALSVSWFRNPGATTTQQIDGVAEGDKLIFVEKTGATSTRSTYSVALNRLTVITERAVGAAEWVPVFEGSYRRPRG